MSISDIVFVFLAILMVGVAALWHAAPSGGPSDIVPAQGEL